MTGHGGWPLTAFCDPDGVPFHCGTYFPPEPRQGMPSFRMVMEAVAAGLGRAARGDPRRGRPDPRAARRDRADPAGGRRDRARRCSSEAVAAPRRPRRPGQRRLRRRAEVPAGERARPAARPRRATEPVELTLDAMAAGGIHDQLGGGFARYSVDARWLVPHFEKMLYDNALLARSYLRGWQELGTSASARSARRSSTGRCARCAAPRAASTPRSTPTPRASRAASTRGPSRRPTRRSRTPASTTWRRRSAPTSGLPRPGTWTAAASCTCPAGWTRSGRPASTTRARRCSRARAKRVRPGPRRQAPPRVERAHGRRPGARRAPRSASPATSTPRSRCVDFLLETMRDDDGRLLRTYKDGRAHLNAYLEDHAYLLEALLDVYEATFDAAPLPGRARDRRRDDRPLRRPRRTAASSPPRTITRS